LLLIDDGSIDSTVEIVKKFQDSRIDIVSDGINKGLSVRLNQAVSMANGKYFCRMDADDIAFSDRLEKQVAFLESNSNVDLVASSVLIFRNDGSIHGVVEVKESHDEICKHPWRGFYFPHPTWMGRLEWFKLHSYTPSADGAEDQLLLYSTFRAHRFAGLNDVLLAYREDSRTFEKIFKRRKIFWRALSINAIKNGHILDFLMLSVLQPLKMIADLLNIKLGIKGAKYKLVKINPSIENRWNLLQNHLIEVSKSK
jgi:glycosyltransferase involved in cell wall biosynthesis